MSLLFEADSSIYPSIDPAYLLAEKIVAGSACILSVLGALLVIFSFTYNVERKFSCKDLYYKICCGFSVQEQEIASSPGSGDEAEQPGDEAEQPGDEAEQPGDEAKREDQKWVTKYKLKSYNFILINLSIADIIVALSHFWGLLSNLEHKFAHNKSAEYNISIIPNGQDVSCTTQGAFTALSTLSSFFWTDILAFFLASNIACKTCTNSKLSRQNEDIERDNGNTKIVVVDKTTNCCDTPLFLYIIFPLLGWGLPMIMVLVFATKSILGYVEDYDGGKLCDLSWVAMQTFFQ